MMSVGVSVKEIVSSVLRKDGKEKSNGKRENKSAGEEEEVGKGREASVI